MNEEAKEVPAFACCSLGIGRWFWVVWESEAEARAFAPALASGYEASAGRAEAKAAERAGAVPKRLPPKWASGYKRGGGGGATVADGGDDGGVARPRSRFNRLSGPSRRRDAEPRLAFLYGAAPKEPPDASGHVTVTRHRIVKQTAGKIHVESEPFDEDEWARRKDAAGETLEDAPRPRTVAVDRATLRADGRVRTSRAQGNRTFYASEEAGIRDVEAELTARHPWCAALGVRFPLSVESVKAAYRRLARTTHPDAGGDPAAFRAVEGAYRAALAYFEQAGDAIA